MNSSHPPSYFCCNSGCTNCRFSTNRKCVKQFSNAKKCTVDFHKNGFDVLGKNTFNTYNIEYGYFPDYLKCFCRTRGKKCKMKTYKQCNCSNECVKISLIIKNKLSKHRSYMKVYNPYGDITYNSVDGWPPTAASSTGHLSGTLRITPQNTKLDILRDLQEQVVARSEKRFYKFNGKIYGHRERVNYPISSKCKRQVSCIPTAVRIS